MPHAAQPRTRAPCAPLPAVAGVPRGRGAAPQDMADTARRVAVQHHGQDWRQLVAQAGLGSTFFWGWLSREGCMRGSACAEQPCALDSVSNHWYLLRAPVLIPHSKRGQMYAELLPDILASRVPKTADGQTYPMAGAQAGWSCGAGAEQAAGRQQLHGSKWPARCCPDSPCRPTMHVPPPPPPPAHRPASGTHAVHPALPCRSVDLHIAAHHHHRLGTALPQSAVEGAGRNPGGRGLPPCVRERTACCVCGCPGPECE